jgi:hypothetical protein
MNDLRIVGPRDMHLDEVIERMRHQSRRRLSRMRISGATSSFG